MSEAHGWIALAVVLGIARGYNPPAQATRARGIRSSKFLDRSRLETMERRPNWFPPDTSDKASAPSASVWCTTNNIDQSL